MLENAFFLPPPCNVSLILRHTSLECLRIEAKI